MNDVNRATLEEKQTKLTDTLDRLIASKMSASGLPKDQANREQRERGPPI